MELNRDNIYKLIAGTLGEDIKTFNPDADLIEIYGVDSLSILDIALVVEDYTGLEVIIPEAALTELTTAKLYADYVLEQHNEPN